MKHFLLIFLGISMAVTSGCATDNEFLAKMPLFEAYSDKIPGLLSPVERKKQIRLKGEKGAKAPAAEQELLVAQLMSEYWTAPDPNMRREAVDAMAKIPHRKRDEFMKEILTDKDPFVRISALEALGKTFAGSRSELVDILAEHLKSDPDKDVRLVAARLLGNEGKLETSDKKNKTPQENLPQVSRELHDTVVFALGDALLDKVPAIRYEAMQSLASVTEKDFGNDINRWIRFIMYKKGETNEMPAERSFAEKLPSIQLPMLK